MIRPTDWRLGWGHGPVLILALTLGIVGSGCERADGPPSDPELRASLGIADHIPIHQVTLSGSGDRTRVFPAHLQVDRGDVVQFRVMDWRVHRVRFAVDEMDPDPSEFLRATGQASPAPLTELDARLVITFEGAPTGEYHFVVEGFGNPVEGSIRVRDP